MKVLNYGSLNIDYVYKLDHFVLPGETISSEQLDIFCGGKGLNQSVALAKAGATVFHAGKIGSDGERLTKALASYGVDVSFVKTMAGPSGHAIIQVTKKGENSIILFGGSNQKQDEMDILETFNFFEENDILLLQNEINNLSFIMEQAYKKGLTIILNPAPMNNSIVDLPLEYVDTLIVNEVEGEQLTGEKEVRGIFSVLLTKYPNMSVVLTLGAEGVCFANKMETYEIKPSGPIEVIDTTAAGDTFIGYYIAGRLQGLSIKTCLLLARDASEICITRNGASPSIPRFDEINLARRLKDE